MTTLERRTIFPLLIGTLCLLTVRAFGQSTPADPPAVLRLPLPPPGPVPAGTQITVALWDHLSSRTARRGEAVAYIVTGDVMTGGIVVIPTGTPGEGTVAAVRDGGAFGRASELRLTCDSLTLPDGRRVAVRLAAPGGAVGRGATAAAGATGGLFGLAVGGATYAAVDFGDNFSLSQNRSHDGTGPALAGLGAGIASGLLIGSLFRGGDADLPAGRTFTVVPTQDVPPDTPAP